jgi:adenylate cyclase
MLGSGMPQVTAVISAAGVEQVQAGKVTLITDGEGSVLLPFRPDTFDRFQKMSAADLLEGGSPIDLKGKYVLIGTAVSGIEDMHPTPLSRTTPGVYVHALLADTLLHGRAPYTPAWEPGLQVLLSALLGLTATVLLAYFPMSVGVILSLTLFHAILAGSFLLLRFQGLAITPVIPALTLLLALGFLVVLRSRIGERYVLERIRELVASQECALRGFASVAETRDPETGAHILRTQHFVRALAQHLSTHPDFRKELTPEHVQLIVNSAPLHDIGKVSVPDAVLLKPGKLTEEEFEVMKQHAATGYEVLRRARAGCDPGDELTFLHYAEEMALTHHEKWDGTGYPQSLREDSIPLSGRLMALADVYDALRSKRVYKPPFSHEKAREIILEGRGKHFDARLVDAFFAIEAEFDQIWELHPDDPQPEGSTTGEAGAAQRKLSEPLTSA